MTVTLCVLLTAVPGKEPMLVEYEDRVLERFTVHGARCCSGCAPRTRPTAPYEVQVIEFPSEAALEAYLRDPVREALAAQREQAIASTQVLRVEVV